MPVDSVHAIIERSINNSIIWAPSQWNTVFATARQDSRPYNVEYLYALKILISGTFWVRSILKQN